MNRVEQDICGAIMKWVYWHEKQVYDFLKDLYHISNEGKRPRFLTKEIGIRAGVSDYHLPHRTESYIGFWMEVKAPGESPSEKQLEWLDRMRNCGHYTCWVDSAQDGIRELAAYCKEVQNAKKE
jgi:hypothetical protein